MKVFISYASDDRDIATGVSGILDDLGIESFLDVKDINWGDNVLTTIHAGLNDCTHLISVISPASEKSQWVPYETGYAAARGRFVLPYLTHAAMNVPGFLTHLHHKSNLEDFREFFEREKGIGIDTKRRLERLLQSRDWRLIFNPPHRTKPIQFGPNDRILAGQNKNEHWWRIEDDKLEIMQSDGRVHSRFMYDESEGKFFHTNDPDTSSIQNQIIEPAD